MYDFARQPGFSFVYRGQNKRIHINEFICRDLNARLTAWWLDGQIGPGLVNFLTE